MSINKAVKYNSISESNRFSKAFVKTKNHIFKSCHVGPFTALAGTLFCAFVLVAAGILVLGTPLLLVGVGIDMAIGTVVRYFKALHKKVAAK